MQQDAAFITLHIMLCRKIVNDEEREVFEWVCLVFKRILNKLVFLAARVIFINQNKL